jgi:hypothetical protein
VIAAVSFMWPLYQARRLQRELSSRIISHSISYTSFDIIYLFQENGIIRPIYFFMFLYPVYIDSRMLLTVGVENCNQLISVRLFTPCSLVRIILGPRVLD